MLQIVRSRLMSQRVRACEPKAQIKNSPLKNNIFIKSARDFFFFKKNYYPSFGELTWIQMEKFMNCWLNILHNDITRSPRGVCHMLTRTRLDLFACCGWVFTHKSQQYNIFAGESLRQKFRGQNLVWWLISQGIMPNE